MIRFSPHDHVNAEVERIILHMGAHPYSLDTVRDAPMGIGDVINEIRRRFSDRAARSIRITVH